MFGSRHTLVDEETDGFGEAVKYFNENYQDVLREISLPITLERRAFSKALMKLLSFLNGTAIKVLLVSTKEGDEMHLALIDAFLKKKGYIEPNNFIDIFCKDERIETPDVIYIGKLDMDFVNSIVNNDWTQEGCQYPNVKEGVVIKRSTLMKGQRLPMCKIKTNWWLNKLHTNFSEEECKIT